MVSCRTEHFHVSCEVKCLAPLSLSVYHRGTAFPLDPECLGSRTQLCLCPCQGRSPCRTFQRCRDVENCGWQPWVSCKGVGSEQGLEHPGWHSSCDMRPCLTAHLAGRLLLLLSYMCAVVASCARWCTPVIPTLQEAEAERSLSSRLAWAA